MSAILQDNQLRTAAHGKKKIERISDHDSISRPKSTEEIRFFTAKDIRAFFDERLKNAKNAKEIRKILMEEWPESNGYETR